MSNQEELEIENAKKDPKKFEVLYDKYFNNVFQFCLQRSRDVNTARDLTSDVFLKALINLNKYQYKGKSFSKWLITIAYNAFNDSYKRRNKERIVRTNYANLIRLFDQKDPYQDQLKTMTIALRQLSQSEIDMIEMKYFESRSHLEIAEILDISENNARVRLHRTIAKLKEIITDELKKKNTAA